MNSWLLIMLLAVVQGIAEFLPVSSSGHLALLSNIADLDGAESLTANIVLHAGSLTAIVIFYSKLLIGFFRKEQQHLFWMVVVGSIPAGIAGVAIKYTGFADRFFSDMTGVAMAFLITASVLRLTSKKKLINPSETPLSEITLKQTLLTGFAQMFALLPGVSRSGATIATGIISGLRFEAAAAFSFLLALPAIAGATLLEIIKLSRNGFKAESFNALQLGCGFAVSAVVSLISLVLLITLIKKQKLHFFAWYLYILGAGMLAWQILKLNGR